MTDRDIHFEPGKLWSLWGMLDHNADAFCRFSSMLGQMIAGFQMNSSPDWEAVVATLAQLHREADRMNMLGVSKVLNRIKEHMTGKPGASTASVRPMIVELYNRLQDDLEMMLFLHVEPDRAAFYSPPNPLFGANVAKGFPSIEYEISEAGKCLALDRSTACAFHLLRAMEAGLRAISRSLSIPDPIKGSQRNWNMAIKSLVDETDKRWPKAARLSGDGVLFETLIADMGLMNNPYRNATMHLEDKYTEDEARHLFAMVKGFMQRVASRMDEDGMPLA